MKPRPEPTQVSHSTRDGLLYMDEKNKVIVLTEATAYKTHLGRLAAGAFSKYSGEFGVLFEGRVLAMAWGNPIDAGINLLEVSGIEQKVIYDYWARNRARSTRKLPPGGINHSMVGPPDLPSEPGPDAA